MASRKANFMKKIMNGHKQTQAASFLKRNPTLKKKAFELHTLCDITVTIVSFGPDGSVEIWPENEEHVRQAIMSYKRLEQKEKRENSLFQFLESKKSKLVKKKNQELKKKLESLSKHVDGLSGQELIEFVNFLEIKLNGFQEKLTSLEIATSVETNTKSALRTRSFQNDPMDEIYKHIVKNENFCNYSENYNVGNGFLYGSSSSNTVARDEANYGDNVAVVDKFYSNNVVPGSSSDSYFGFVEVNNIGPYNAQESLDFMVDVNDLFCWDGEMVRF